MNQETIHHSGEPHTQDSTLSRQSLLSSTEASSDSIIHALFATSPHAAESPRHFSCQLDEDLQLLLESPSARAASANFFSSHVGTLDPNTVNSAYDLFRSGSLGSPDFTRQLNMAGFFDTNHQPLSPLAAQQQQGVGALQPEMVLQQPGNLQQDSRPGPSLAVQCQKEQRQQQPGPHQQQIVDARASVPASPLWATAGTGIAAVAPTAPVQQPAVVVQQPEQQLKQVMTAFDSNNESARMPLLRPLQVRAPAAGANSGKLPSASWGAYIPAAAKAIQQQQEPDTPQKQPPKQQQQQGQQTMGQPSQLQEQQSSPEASALGTADRKLAAGTWRSASPQQQLAARQDAAHAETAAAVQALDAGVAHAAAAAVCQVGTLVWAKFPRFPWWPAILISATADVPPPPATSSSGTAAPVLVRFLGTHDVSWVEPDRAISPWGTNQSVRSGKTKAAAFLAALREADAYANTGALPEAFSTPPQLSVPPAAAATKAKASKGKQSAAPTAEPATNRATPPTPTNTPAAAAAAAHQDSFLDTPDVWSYTAAPAAAAAEHPAGLLVPASALGHTGAMTLGDLAPTGLPPVSPAGVGGSKHHRVQRGSAAGSRAPAGPAAGLRSGDKRTAAGQHRGRSSKRSRVEYQK